MSDTNSNPPSTVASHYRDESGAKYFKYQSNAVEIANRIILPMFEPYVRPTDTVVDFGCGTGWLLRLLPGTNKLGVEPNQAARQYAAEHGTQTVAATSELADDLADVVVSSHALEHTLNPYDELTGIKRVLKPSGRLVIIVPMEEWRSNRKVDPNDPNHHLFTWTPQLFNNLLSEAGFAIDEIRGFTYLPPYYNEWLYPRLPRPIFDLLAKSFGRYKRYHQLFALARPH